MSETITLSTTGEVATVQGVVAAEIAALKDRARRAEARTVALKTDELARERRRRAVRRELDAEERAERAAVDGKLIDRILDVDGFLDAEPPMALVKDVLDGGGTSMFIGHRGSYKTAIALDMALCIATGTSWGRHRTERGRVLYLVGEGGGRAFGIRLEAWLTHHDIARDEIRPWFRGVDGAVPLMSDAWDELVEFARDYRPALIVVDTLARHQIGLDENSNSDASDAVAKADHLRAETGAAVMLLHHPPKGGSSGRGASAWEGAADSVFLLTKDEPVPGQVEMVTTKQKHRPETGKWAFRIRQVDVAANGIWPTSMVPVHADPLVVDKAAVEAKAARDAALQTEVLAYIRGREAADMAPNKSEFRDHFNASKRREAALDALADLRMRGEVEEVPGKGRSRVLHVVADATILPFSACNEGADA
ncbi:AAA family ATPase [Gordonia sp. N1V]|uniref:AAA family ATPase n=1 Tax=Gordonia sp. N1V TaxID=3034163 RepID=UPI0023E3263F|nr:AAA family ATPase [Gordonia sp. N1V]MDF3283373.1 AAA family ATPase [Gordonia sp. N1V]